MGQLIIDDRNDEWYEFVKHFMEQEVQFNKPIDDLICEALQNEPENRSQTMPFHSE